jgi:RNA polymerase sigma-70 factor (ECF subfamily)
VRSDREQFLLFRIRSFQDQRAFAELFLEHKQALYTFLRSRLPTKEDADDLLNAVFLRAWNFILTSHANEKDHFSGLIFHTARFALKDYWKGKRNEVSLTDMQEAGQDIPDPSTSGTVSEAGAEVRLIKEAIGRLSEEYQEVIVLRIFEQLDYDEIAKRMEKNAGAVRVTLHRALKELRKYV